MAKNSKIDPMTKLSKEAIVRAYHAKSAELELYWRFENFRARGLRPVVMMQETIPGAVAENTLASSSLLQAELYAPRAIDGGILRIEYRRYLGEKLELATAQLFAWESFKRDRHHGSEYRALINRIAAALYRKLPRAPIAGEPGDGLEGDPGVDPTCVLCESGEEPYHGH
jgi:hypothetical protein